VIYYPISAGDDREKHPCLTCRVLITIFGVSEISGHLDEV